MTFPPEVWDGVLRLLKARLPEYTVEAWIQPLKPRLDAEVLYLECPTSFHRDRVRDRFLGNLRDCVRAELGNEIDVEVEIARAPAATAVGEPSLPRAKAKAQAKVPTKPRSPLAATPPAKRAAPRPADATPPMVQPTFRNFVVGSCNALAREASLAMARDQRVALHQLYIAAGAGLGKTHLCRAVVAETRRIAARRVLYTSAESFTNEFLSSVRGGRMGGFKKRYRQGQQVLVVEDVQFLAGKRQTQLEFFYTLRHVIDAGGRVLLTGDRLPHEMTTLDDQVRDQLGNGFVARLEPPDAQVRRDILCAKAAGGGVRLPDECVDLLVERVHGSVRDLESVLVQLVTMASLFKKPIDLPLAQEALATRLDGETPRRQRLDVDAVVRVVAGFFKTTPESLASRSRRRDVLAPRQLAMYLCHRYTDASLADIGRAFGRSHPAVRNAITKMEREVTERAPRRYQVEALVDRLEVVATGANSKPAS